MTEPSWLTRARRFIGLAELPGVKNSPELMAVLDWADGKQDGKTIGAQNDDEAYCSKGVCAVLEMCGIRSTRSPAAQSFKAWGQTLDDPALGAIVVFWRKTPESGLGHVGFVAGKDGSGNLMVLGFNQADAVNVKPFSPHRVLSFRWPAGQALPKTGWPSLPLLKSDGRPSQNEA